MNGQPYQQRASRRFDADRLDQLLAHAARDTAGMLAETTAAHAG